MEDIQLEFSTDLLNNYKYNYDHYSLHYLNRLIDFELGEVKCNGEQYFTAYNLTKTINTLKSGIINYASNTYQLKHTRLQLLGPGAAGAFKPYFVDYELRETRAYGSRET